MMDTAFLCSALIHYLLQKRIALMPNVSASLSSSVSSASLSSTDAAAAASATWLSLVTPTKGNVPFAMVQATGTFDNPLPGLAERPD